MAYNLLSRSLHWLIALLIIAQLTSGYIMVTQTEKGTFLDSVKSTLSLYDLHKLMGLVILALMLIRFANRTLTGVPDRDQPLPIWQYELSSFVHRWLYLVVISTAVLGWIGISLYPALVIFSSLEIPSLAAADRELSKVAFKAHTNLAYVVTFFVCVHIAAALYHRFVLKDETLSRMWPGRG